MNFPGRDRRDSEFNLVRSAKVRYPLDMLASDEFLPTSYVESNMVVIDF